LAHSTAALRCSWAALEALTAGLKGFSWAKLYLQNLAIFRANAGEYANIAYDFGM